MRLILLAVLIAGCQPIPPQTIDEQLEEKTVRAYLPGHVYDFTLEDGTRCIYVGAGYDGGLSCDFNHTHTLE